MGKTTNSMAIFNSYASLPEGNILGWSASASADGSWLQQQCLPNSCEQTTRKKQGVHIS